MPRLRHEGSWWPARDIPFLALSVAVVLSMIRTVDQPSFSVQAAGTDVSMVLVDAALVVVFVAVLSRLLGSRWLPRPARELTYVALALSVWLLATSIANGSEAFTGAARLLEYGLLGIGAVLFVQRRRQLWFLLGLLTGVLIAADLYALKDFFGIEGLGRSFETPGRRQPSFLGWPDYTALSGMVLLFGLTGLYDTEQRLRKVRVVAVCSGALGVVLGAALAGLIGVYLGIAVVLCVAAMRRSLNRRGLVVTILVALAVTAGVLSLRSDNLSSALRFVGAVESETSGDSAGSLTQRLIYAYIGGKVFLDNPVIGTGWYGVLPGSEYSRYLDEAHARFPNQPDFYFPTAEGGLTPQEAYDQILVELGIVGALLFVLLGVIAVRTSLRIARTWPLRDADVAVAYLPLAWVALFAGTLGGAGLFGGNPLTALFWLALGVVALTPSLAPPRAVAPRPAEEPELAATAR